jgi:hypothetical protein
MVTPVVPKVSGAPPWGGARDPQGGHKRRVEKKKERNLNLAIFSQLYLPYILSPGTYYEFHHTMNLF